MTQRDNQLHLLRQEVINMSTLVRIQIEKGKEMLVLRNKNSATEIVCTKKEIDAYECRVDARCGKLFAVHNPLMHDMSFLLLSMKITNNLENIANIAYVLSQYILENKKTNTDLLRTSALLSQLDVSNDILWDIQLAFENESPKLADKIMQRAVILKMISDKSIQNLEKIITNDPENTASLNFFISIIHKLQRATDQIKSIAKDLLEFEGSELVTQLINYQAN